MGSDSWRLRYQTLGKMENPGGALSQWLLSGSNSRRLIWIVSELRILAEIAGFSGGIPRRKRTAKTAVPASRTCMEASLAAQHLVDSL
jgi:hypothetical protein